MLKIRPRCRLAQLRDHLPHANIGDNFFAHAHSIVREGCRIGNRVILQNGAVIGGDGLGFAKQKDGTWYKMQQSGPAVLEDDVEVQSNACVDRATVGETRIGRGTKLDDLVLVGHASQIGANTMLCGQVGLAGSTKVGSGCILAGQVGTAGHLSIGDGAVITAKSGIPGTCHPALFIPAIPPPTIASGLRPSPPSIASPNFKNASANSKPSSRGSTLPRGPVVL